MGKSFDIVGYTFKGASYCPEHIVEAVTSTEEYDGWALADRITMPVEDNLNEIAAAFGIDRQDESSFDSDEFPKVIFRDQLNDSLYCDNDYVPLGEGA